LGREWEKMSSENGAANVEKEVVLTPQGLKDLEGELEYLRGDKRREVAERMKQAKSFGDISENSEYDEARMEQAQVETKIVQLENMLKNARVIDEEDVTTDRVSIGCKVRLLDVEMGEETEFLIVGSAEANPAENTISNESPVGSALIGNKRGKTVDVQAPGGTLKFKILGITK
jgi:transcription elongation factor GreA